MSRSTRFAIGIAITATVVSGCGGGSDDAGGGAEAASSDEPIVIGASVSLTGPYASSGANVSNGYQLAVDQINENGGVLGRQLELDLQDDQSDAGIVSRLYTEFLGTDEVDAVLSPYGSALSGPAAQLAERYQTPMVHSQTSSAAVFEGTEWSVMAGLGPGDEVLAQVPAFAVEAGYTDITLVNNDLDAFSAICDGVEAAIEDAGATLVDRIEYAAATSDFSSTALRISEGAPEVVVMCSAIQDSIGLTRALDQQGFRPAVVASPTAVDPAFAESLGALAEKAVGYTQFAPALGYEGSEEFVEGYEAEHGTVNTQAAGAYATVQVLAAAIEEAGSTEKEAVNTALHEGTFETILGEYSVDENGVQTGYEPVLFQWIGGEQVIVYPSDVEGAVEPQLPY
ncbi:amino acid/amide ABC transporter substrate-binding protein (HAAT family) [Blastococcus colisei]|uniref:Amino acid/amide ABC transporter substrate-binding protein (HAAT family) n=1 Tax=Blastococcus colisei TaxID=1564162 RepID=A0A543PA75_9ACTN|nr:amino acid ABC transporter substrate-binding protein [Blastococcus colisei]TQN40987.1 amino acid/amide ABC transporter substrate-binding protein (HAAT family) [Blastococcus colisei]